jgi:hypothetical protein
MHYAAPGAIPWAAMIFQASRCRFGAHRLSRNQQFIAVGSFAA